LLGLIGEVKILSCVSPYWRRWEWFIPVPWLLRSRAWSRRFACHRFAPEFFSGFLLQPDDEGLVFVGSQDDDLLLGQGGW